MLARLFKLARTGSATVEQPVLSTSDLYDLQYRSENLHLPALHTHEVAHRQFGDARSVYRGYGLDYEESRPYQAGDEMRFMNWRLSARTSELYVKVFREERRPSVFILVDRRMRMRFGSRKRLKSTQASRVAALVSYLARQHNAPVGGVLLENSSHWIPEQVGETGLYNFINVLTTPCPPLDYDNSESLEHVLRLLSGMLAQGSIIYLASDFYDLDMQARAVLLELATRHKVHAVVISDQNEHELPDIGGACLGSSFDNDGSHLDSSDVRTRSRYATLSHQHYENVRAILSIPGISYTALAADDDDIEQRVPCP